jgi:hypothetical protein
MPRRVNIFRRGSRPQTSARLADAPDALAQASGLDRTIRVLSTAVRRTVHPGPVKDALHGVPLGHPAHPPLTDVPFGLWLSAAVLDLVPGTRRASQALVAAGLAGALPTALTGIADWGSLHREQQRVGLVHAAGMATTGLLYSASLVARYQGRDAAGRAFGFAGLSTLLAGGFLGRHLAFRQAAGASHAEKVGHLVTLGWHDVCSAADLPDGWPVQPPGRPPPPGPHRQRRQRRRLRRLPLARQHFPGSGRLGRPRPRDRPPAGLRNPGDRRGHPPGPPPGLNRGL